MSDTDLHTSDVSRWGWRAAEVLTCLGSAALYLASCTLIKVAPLQRLGQISGMASLALRVVVFGALFAILLVLAARLREGRRFEVTSRLVCAALAGISSAIVAGGIMVALRGTPWGINAVGGDVGALSTWASALQRGEPIPPLYPPLSIHVLSMYANAMDVSPALALKDLQILGTAAFGPAAYLSWRLLLRPVWALGIGCIAMLPLIEPYKPYPNLVLVVFVPLAVLFLDTLRKSAEHDLKYVVRASIGFGVAFGVSCLLYSGWFQWSAPGLFIATLVLFPWREGRKAGLMLLGFTGLVFAIIAGYYLLGLLTPEAKVADPYVYFDVKVEPMYIAMWRNDIPGDVGTWPPHGELGGVAVFTLLLAAGWGASIALARRTTLVITLSAVMASAWLLRFLYARMMWQTKLVQLYPRTTAILLYCLLLVTGYAIYVAVRRLRDDHPMRGPSGIIGAVCALALVFASAGTATSDRWMPNDSDPPGAGVLTLNSHRYKWSFAKKTFRSRVMSWGRRPREVTN